MKKAFILNSKDVFYRLLSCMKDASNTSLSSTLIVYQFLLSLRNNKKRYAVCSISKIEHRTGLSNHTIVKYINKLEEYGFLFLIKNKGNTTKYLFPLEDYYLDFDALNNYPNIITSLDGNIKQWNTYCTKFFI